MNKKRNVQKAGPSSAPVRSTSGRDATAPLRFGVLNAVFAALSLVALVGGYVLLSQGSITAAPLLLVVGYVVLVPAAILS